VSFVVEFSETDTKHLLLHAQCFPSYQLVPWPHPTTNNNVVTATLNTSTAVTATLNNSNVVTATLNISNVVTATLNNSNVVTATLNNSNVVTATYMTYRTANLQTLHFKYLFNKYSYWNF
jgi:hypothetical protein